MPRRSPFVLPLCLCAVALAAADYEPVQIYAFLEELTDPGTETVTRPRGPWLRSDIPCFKALPAAPVIPAGLRLHRSPGATERWLLTPDPERRRTVLFDEAEFRLRPADGVPALLMGLAGPDLRLPRGCVRAVCKPAERAAGVPTLDFRGEDAGPTTFVLGERELPARRFTFAYEMEGVRTEGEIVHGRETGSGVLAFARRSSHAGKELGAYRLRLSDVRTLEDPAYLKAYPAAGLAYARPRSFVEREAVGEEYLRYANPQGIVVSLAPAAIPDPLRTWWSAHREELLAGLPAAVGRTAGWRGYALNDPIYGWVEESGTMHGFIRHDARGFRVRIAGYDRLDENALRLLFLGLRWEAREAPGP